MLPQLLSKIMDLPYQEAFNEGNNKLAGTFMVLNGKLVKVNEFGFGGVDASNISYYDKSEEHQLMDGKNVKSLELWTPDSGVYNIDGKIYCLRKRPYRKWRKSFNWDTYQVDKDPPMGHFKLVFKMFDIGVEPVEFHKDMKYVYFYNTRIGNVNKDGSLDIFNPLFHQEILDLQRDNPAWKP